MPLVGANVDARLSPRLRRGTFCADVLPENGPAAEPGAVMSRRWRGMTLIELLVVLALLVLIGSIVVPVFTGTFSSVRLRRAGDQVLTRWSRARARAIDSGNVFQFTYTPESGAYQIGPWSGMTVGGEGASRTARTAMASEPVTTEAASADEAAAGQSAALPDKIVFHSGEIGVEDVTTGERQAASLEQQGDSASTAILFFPDGTTSQASVVLSNDRNQFVRLTLRGLTGVGRATEILSQEELQRAQRRR
jgi:prepilin-type N-terminal cleavage/methylation domain-containing protein